MLLGLGLDLREARADRWRFTGDLELDLRYTRFSGPVADEERADSLVGGLALSAFAGRQIPGLAVFLECHFGGGLQGGFAYDVALHPIGLGLAFGHRLRLSATAGIGAQGLTGHIPPALRIPLRVAAHLELGDRVHLATFAQAAYVSFADERERGSESTPLGDELAAGGYLRIGKGGDTYGADWGNGYLIGGTYQEMLGGRQFLVVFGYGIGVTADM